MADKLQIEIGLDGAEEVNQRLRQIEQTAANVTRTVVNFAEVLAQLGATAALTAGVALVKFAQGAAQLEKSLSSLQAVTGQSIQNLSAMQQVFTAGGTSAKEFAGSLTKISQASADVAAKIKAQSVIDMFGKEQGKQM